MGACAGGVGAPRPDGPEGGPRPGGPVGGPLAGGAAIETGVDGIDSLAVETVSALLLASAKSNSNRLFSFSSFVLACSSFSIVDLNSSITFCSTLTAPSKPVVSTLPMLMPCDSSFYSCSLSFYSLFMCKIARSYSSLALS